VNYQMTEYLQKCNLNNQYQL